MSDALEDLRRSLGIVDVLRPVWTLHDGMVFRINGKPRVVVTIRLQTRKSGLAAIVKTATGLETLASDSEVEVWHQNGQPFLLELPLSDLEMLPPPTGGSPPPAPAHDVAGIVPDPATTRHVPKRRN
jgi:hypothetical protein